MDGEDTSVETLLNAFERFLGAIGISVTPNVILGFVEVEETDEETDEDEGEDGEENQEHLKIFQKH